MEPEKTMLICDHHQVYPTPLISTMAFPYRELWCPYCGESIGLFDGGVEVKNTPELEYRKEMYSAKYSEYLHACCMTYAYGVEWDGKIIDPKDLPQEEKDRLKLIRETDWEAYVEIEDISLTKQQAIAAVQKNGK